MAASQKFLVCDSSTYANFFNWASAISAAFATFGWAQSTDTGQVMWSGMSISAVSMSGTTATYTYAALTGLPLFVGRALTVTGLVNAGNNKTVVITAFTGTTSGTFTVTNATGVTESGSSGAVTAQTTVPGSAAYLTEVWTPNDGLTNFYVKMEYGNFSGTNGPNIRVTLGSGTNGASTLTGFVTTALLLHNLAVAPPSTTTLYECNFSGALGRMGCMMWRNAPGNVPCIFAIERSVDVTGAYTATYATVVVGGQPGGNTNQPSFQQQSLVFGIGASVVSIRSTVGVSNPQLAVLTTIWPGVGASAFNNSIPFSPVFPVIGYFDYPMTAIGVGAGFDYVEGVTFQTSLFGSTRTYLPSKNGFLSECLQTNTANGIICLRFD